jgi:hypothetical protein
VDVASVKAETEERRARLDQCEASTTPFVQMMERRRVQEESLCRGAGLTAMLAACCPSQGGNGHRRFLQEVEGCAALPATCPAACAPLFIEYFEGCQGIIEGLAPDERQGFQELYGNCQEGEQAAAEMGTLQPVNVKMYRIMISSETAQSHVKMFGEGLGGYSTPIIGPLPELPSLPPPHSPTGGSTDLEQYHA